MKFLRKIRCGAVLISGCLFFSSYGYGSECPKWFQKLGDEAAFYGNLAAHAVTSTAQNTALEMKNLSGATWKYLKDYAVDIKNTRGRRLLLVERGEEGEKFNWLQFSVEPFSETANKLSVAIRKKPLKYSPSFWATIPLGAYTWDNLIEFSDRCAKNIQFKRIVEQREKIPGSSYAIELFSLHLSDQTDLLDSLNEHIAEVNAFVMGKQNTGIDRRIEELKKSGALKTDKEAAAFRRMLRKTFIETLEKYPPNVTLPKSKIASSDEAGEIDGMCFFIEEIRKKINAPAKPANPFATELTEAFDKNIDQLFPGKSPEEKELLRFAIRPKTKILNQTDFGLAKRVLDSKVFSPIALEFGLPYAMGLVSATDLDREDGTLKKKQDEANKIPEIASLPKEKKLFLERIDIPEYGEDLKFSDIHGKERILKGELGRWELFLTDWHFEGWAAKWKANKISDLDAMKVVQGIVDGINVFNSVARKPGTPTQAHVCAILEALDGDEGSGIRALFSPVDSFMEKIASQKKFTAGESNYCREELVRFVWRSRAEWESAGKKLSQAQKNEADKEFVGLANSCFTEKAKQFKSSCK